MSIISPINNNVSNNLQQFLPSFTTPAVTQDNNSVFNTANSSTSNGQQNSLFPGQDVFTASDALKKILANIVNPQKTKTNSSSNTSSTSNNTATSSLLNSVKTTTTSTANSIKNTTSNKTTTTTSTQTKNTNGLTDAQQQVVDSLKKDDTKVRAHEAAHLSTAVGLALGESFTYTTGPDGKQYATGGDVQVDMSTIPGDPQATIDKMQQVIRAALAPSDPSPQDRAVAAQASSLEAEARSELAAQQNQSLTNTRQANQNNNNTNDLGSVSKNGTTSTNNLVNNNSSSTNSTNSLLGLISKYSNNSSGSGLFNSNSSLNIIL